MNAVPICQYRPATPLSPWEKEKKSIGTECGLSVKGIDSGPMYVTSFNKGSTRIHPQAHNAA